MRKWKKTINIKNIIKTNQNTDNWEIIVQKAKDLLQLLEPLVEDEELDAICVALEDVTYMFGDTIWTSDGGQETGIEYFNRCLEDLYDWGDKHSVWLG